MKLRERWRNTSSNWKFAISFTACCLLFVTFLVGVVPMKYVGTNTQEYEVVSVFYNHVVGWNNAPGDRDFYQVTWVGDDGQVNVGSFLVRDDSVRISETDLVRVESYFSESLFGLRGYGQNIFLHLTNETLADLQGGA